MKMVYLKIIIRQLILLSFFILLSSYLYARDTILPNSTPEEVGLSTERLEKIENIFKEGIQEKKIPGAVIAIARYGKLAYFKAFGMQNPISGTPMSTDSIFRIYSMSKPIVSVGAMILNEEGKLYLSEPVNKYIPDLSNMKVSKTIKNEK